MPTGAGQAICSRIAQFYRAAMGSPTPFCEPESPQLSRALWLVNSPASRSSSDVKKFSLLREFNQQPGIASSLQTLGTCVSVSQGRVGCRKAAFLHVGSVLSPLMLLSLWSRPCCNCCCLCRCVNSSPAALSHTQSAPHTLTGHAPCTHIPKAVGAGG